MSDTFPPFSVLGQLQRLN